MLFAFSQQIHNPLCTDTDLLDTACKTMVFWYLRQLFINFDTPYALISISYHYRQYVSKVQFQVIFDQPVFECHGKILV